LTLFIDTFLVSHRIRQRRTKVPSFTAAEKELQHTKGKRHNKRYKTVKSR
jgi:hypothetical protein